MVLHGFYTVLNTFYTSFKQFLHRFYTSFTQFLHQFYAVFTRFLHGFVKICQISQNIPKHNAIKQKKSKLAECQEQQSNF